MIALRNLARTSFTVNLDLEHDYEGHAECAPHDVRMVLPAVTPTGEDGVRHYERRCPGSVTWQAGEEKTLPDAVALLAPVRARMAQKLMRATPVAVQPPAAPEPEPAPPAAAQPPPQSARPKGRPPIVSPDGGA